MKLISVQSRGDRLVTIEEYDSFYVVVAKVIIKDSFISRRFWQTTTSGIALKSAAEWLEGCKE